jgi:hypothetical protein
VPAGNALCARTLTSGPSPGAGLLPGDDDRRGRRRPRRNYHHLRAHPVPGVPVPVGAVVALHPRCTRTGRWPDDDGFLRRAPEGGGQRGGENGESQLPHVSSCSFFPGDKHRGGRAGCGGQQGTTRHHTAALGGAAVGRPSQRGQGPGRPRHVSSLAAGRQRRAGSRGWALDNAPAPPCS